MRPTSRPTSTPAGSSRWCCTRRTTQSGSARSNLLQNPAYTNAENSQPTGSLDPRFTGTGGLAQCLAFGVSATYCAAGGGIAVEQCGTAGTADSHWREVFTTNCMGTNNAPVGGVAAFDSEVMTSYVESSANMPWSAMGIAPPRRAGSRRTRGVQGRNVDARGFEACFAVEAPLGAVRRQPEWQHA